MRAVSSFIGSRGAIPLIGDNVTKKVNKLAE